MFLTWRDAFAKQKLHIGIFIESECRYSIQFITQQFRPTYQRIKDLVDVEFFTFGKSESFIGENGDVNFKCQHGPVECRKNKLQTCGLNFIGADKYRQGINLEAAYLLRLLRVFSFEFV